MAYVIKWHRPVDDGADYLVKLDPKRCPPAKWGPQKAAQRFETKAQAREMARGWKDNCARVVRLRPKQRACPHCKLPL